MVGGWILRGLVSDLTVKREDPTMGGRLVSREKAHIPHVSENERWKSLGA
jgi:hypothetical protein